TVIAGRLQTAGYDWACANNATGGAGFDVQTKLGTLNNANYLLQCGNNGRASNAFAYVSPTFSGFSFAYNHARVTEDRILDATNQADLGNSYANLYAANYLNGPIDVRFVFARIELNSQATPGSTTEVGINGGYDFKVVKFNASWQQSKMENFDANSKWHIQGVVPLFAAGAIIGDYGQNSIKSNATGNNSLSDNSKSFTLAYTHNLSKRTTAYAAYNRVTNSVDASLGSMSNFAMPTAGGNASVASLGVRHSF
ncbi:MAG: porin, partial [Betaproteobacteria bacterium]